MSGGVGLYTKKGILPEGKFLTGRYHGDVEWYFSIIYSHTYKFLKCHLRAQSLNQ